MLKLLKCKDCKKELTKYAIYHKNKRCKSCNLKWLHKTGKINNKGINNGNYGKKFSLARRKKMRLARKNVIFTDLWKINIGKAMQKRWKSKEYRKKISNVKYHRHHIDLNTKNNKKKNIMILTKSLHSYLHKRAYKYLVITGQIQKYIKWFKKDFKQVETHLECIKRKQGIR
jgi:hypothetical protein